MLARSISNQHRAADGALHVITLSPRIEKILSEAMGDPSQGITLHLDPHLAQQMLEATSKQMEVLATKGYVPIILCSTAVRRVFRQLTERILPNLTVLSYNEITSGVDVQAEGMVELPRNETVSMKQPSAD
jgi:flagellar biosynthesis protein FlhA